MTTGMDDWDVRRWMEWSAMLKLKRPRKPQSQRRKKGDGVERRACSEEGQLHRVGRSRRSLFPPLKLAE